jgi:hypothetical protein
MSPAWRFNKVRPGDRTRESQVEKFFKSSEDRASPIVREGIQNSLDAAPDEKIVRVRLTIGKGPKSLWTSYGGQLMPHIMAIGDKLGDLPGHLDEFRFLVFEDFETSGLTGDPAQWQFEETVKNPFFEFFRAEGVSNKEGSSRGRHGVGKFVFMAASRVRTIFGLTRREDDGRELLMGTTVLRHHHLGAAHYMPDGWYGVDDPNQQHNVLPLENDAAIATFKSDFKVSRANEPGLTIVVPWLDSEVKRNSVIKAVVEGYFVPLMRNTLVVEVVDDAGGLERIDHASIREVVDRQGEAYAKQMLPRLKLAEDVINAKTFLQLKPPPGEHGAPKWAPECFTAEAKAEIQAKLGSGEFLAIECPTRVRKKSEKYSVPDKFQVFMRREPGAEFDAHYIRQGILVSDLRPRRISGLRAIVLIDDGPLATFLGDSENPAHTEWLSEHVKQYSFNRATIDYVVNSLSEIASHTAEDQKAPDPLPMRDLFFLPSDEPRNTAKQTKPKGAGKDPPEFPKNMPAPKPKSYRISRIEGGFVVRRGDAPRPESLEIVMAYDTHRGNPFKRYDPADFQLDKGGITVEYTGVDIKEYDSNRLKADVNGDDFEIRVEGFDPNRDLIVNAKAKTSGAAAPEEDHDAEAV